MRARIDWIKIKNQFIVGDWTTITDYFRENNIKDNSRNRLHTKGWLVEKREYQEEIIRRTRVQIIEKEVDVRIRQQKLAQELQTKGIEALQELSVKDIEDARKLVVSGLEQEREALGMKGKTDANLTQVNVNLPKTRFDELLEDQDLEGLLRLLVDIEKEKRRRCENRV